MNYFGLFFTFMVPGLVLGALAAVVLREEKQKRAQPRRRAAREMQVMSRSKLYIHDLRDDTCRAA